MHIFNKKQDDLYIKVLTYGKDNIGKPIKYNDLHDHLVQEGYEFDEFALKSFFTNLFVDKHSPDGNHPANPSKKGEFFLENEGYFHLLEYEELQSARKSSLIATRFATLAILISIVSTVVSIYYSNKQLNTPVKIELSHLERMSNESIVKLLEKLKENSQTTTKNIEILNKHIKNKQYNNLLNNK